jgi:fused signal recognition particle receptor
MFGFIKKKITKLYDQFTSKINSIFSRNKLDDEFLVELKKLLISADTGVQTTNKIIEKLTNDIKNTKITTLEQTKVELEALLLAELEVCCKKENLEFYPKVMLMVGVNGSGKTTFLSKFAYKLKQDGKKVLLVAGDTFRAAATQQLEEWAKRIDVEIFVGKENQDAASVVFDACKKFKDEKFDHIVIDTAGRLQTKVNLMKELEKIKKIVGKVLPESKVYTWLTIDAMLGQNSFAQAQVFNEATKLDGIVLTKIDGSGKGGIVFSITQKLNLPIVYITFGEKLEDIRFFEPKEYVRGLFEG